MIINIALLVLTLQNGEQTLITGRTISVWLIKVLNLSEDVETFHITIRVVAHFLFFILDGLLFYMLLRKLTPTMLIVLTLAIVTELVKIPIAGRHFSLMDCAYNVLAGCGGCVAAVIFVRAGEKRRIQN
ncbi:MAG: hypothetical protein K6C08_14435 [Oscillospiraceae bacterium]|nr:hypothetical protein [Oscillospiraceae bacterium]